MTTDDLPQGLPAATRLRRGALRILCCAALCAASLPLFAAPAPAPTGAAQPMSDSTPLPDRSAMFAGDLDALFASTNIAAAAPQPKLSDRIQGVLSKAMTLLGTPYRWGGTSPDGGFDCSGLVGYVFRTALGVELPRVSRDMYNSGQAVADRAALTPGDLVFFGLRGRVNHVGIYVGEGRFLHAPSTGKDVRVDSLASGYWSGRFLQGRRVAM